MDIVFVDGKIAADRAAILIIKVKRINPYIKIMALEKIKPIRRGFWTMVLMNLQQNPLALKL